jgi:hypothetical protein
MGEHLLWQRRVKENGAMGLGCAKARFEYSSTWGVPAPKHAKKASLPQG